MMVTIRPATKQDQAAIKALIRQVGINPLGLKWPRFLVAVDQADQLIGCGQVKPHRDGSQELASIAVQKGWRKQGIAWIIIKALQDSHPIPLWLMCRSELRSFYEVFGFVEIMEPGQMPPYFRRTKRFAHLFTKITRQEIRIAVMVNNPMPDKKMEFNGL